MSEQKNILIQMKVVGRMTELRKLLHLTYDPIFGNLEMEIKADNVHIAMGKVRMMIKEYSDSLKSRDGYIRIKEADKYKCVISYSASKEVDSDELSLCLGYTLKAKVWCGNHHEFYIFKLIT